MQKPTILVAEDEPSIRELIDDFLASEGFVTLTARNGREAIAVAMSRQPDIVLMDMMLPEMDGAEAIRCLRHDARTSSIRVIAMSADARALQTARALTVDGMLSKPFDLSDLLALIATQCASAPATH